MKRVLIPAGAGLLVLTIGAAIWAIGDLREAGQSLDLARAAARPPRLDLAPDAMLVAADARQGAARLAAHVADRASAIGLRLATRLPDDAQTAGIATIDIETRGSEAALRDFAAAVEQGRPLLRFVRWHVGPAGDGSLRLTGRLAAPLALPGRGNMRGILIPVPRPPPSPETDSTPLFAIDAGIDAVPTQAGGGPPPLLGIVGRLSAPSVMVRGADGAIRTIGLGGIVEGWTLIAVAADRATFRRGREERAAVLPARADPDQ